MSQIHASAIIEDGAKLGKNVKIGPFCYVGSNVVLEDNVELKSHVVIDGITVVGTGTVIYSFASIGSAPQDKKYNGEQSRLEIGSNNTIREYVTMQPGTSQGGMLTKVGNNGLFMVGVHIAHDCQVGNDVVFANHATLAGHVTVEDYVTIGGLSGIHQFVRLGAHSMIGGLTKVDQDVIPFGIVVGDSGYLSGLNLIGLKRRGFSSQTISSLREAYKAIFIAEDSKTFSQRVTMCEQRYGNVPDVKKLIDFIQQDSQRYICHPKQNDL